MNENEIYAFVLQNQIVVEGHMMLWQHFQQGSNDQKIGLLSTSSETGSGSLASISLKTEPVQTETH